MKLKKKLLIIRSSKQRKKYLKLKKVLTKNLHEQIKKINELTKVKIDQMY